MRTTLISPAALTMAFLVVGVQACTKNMDNDLPTNLQEATEEEIILLAAAPRYLTYDGTGAQSDLANYNNLASAPTTAPSACSGNSTLCWIRVNDVDEDDDVDAADFTATFNALDSDADGTLNDESEVPGILEKRS